MYQNISGLYKGTVSNPSESRVKKTELELRIDVDGSRPLNTISGDFYLRDKNIRNYLSSFIFQGIKKIETPANRILLIGNNGKFSSKSTKFTEIKILVSANSNSPKVIFQGINGSRSKIQGLCSHISRYFRTVYLEHDYEVGVSQLEPCEITNLSSSSSQRLGSINLIDVFAEAGIEIIILKEKRDSVCSPKGTPISKGVWTDKELQQAMQENFISFNDEPQWKLWLLSANEFVMSNFYGIMIDHQGKKRRGCAIFQSSTGWQSFEEKRFRFFIYIHELGHCFNLHHSWEKPQTELDSEVNRYARLSWMNLPWRYYSSENSHGNKAFWEAFNFEFDPSELIHLRHGLRNDVIFGGNPYSRKIDSKSNS